MNDDDSFRLAFELGPIGKALIDPDGRYVRVNPALCAVLGYPGSQLTDRVVADLVHPDDTAGYRTALSLLRSGALDTVDLELRYCTSSGGTVVAAESIRVLRGGDGRPLRFVSQVQDVTRLREQDRELRRERRRVREAQVIGRVGSWEVDVATDRITWSDALFELRGIDPATFTGDWAAGTSMVHPDDRQRVRAAVEEARHTAEQTQVRYRARRADDNRERWFDARAKAIHEDGRLVTVAGTVADVTEDVLAEQAARSALAFQQAVITASPDITFVYDLNRNRTLWVSRSVIALLGYPPRDPHDDLDAFVLTLIPGPDRAQFEAAGEAAMDAANDEVVSVNFRMVGPSGEHRWFSRRTTTLERDQDGRVTQVVGVLRDITEAKTVEQRLQHSALHDELTGLPNRALLIDRLRGALIRSGHDRREISVLFCDLDGFKRVNDTAGHAAGDAVLIETARRLQGVLREGDTVARVGGDEFVIVIEPWNRPDPVTDATSGGGVHTGPRAPRPGDLDADRLLGPQIAERVARALRRPIEVNGVDHVISASIGITYGPIALPGLDSDTAADLVLQDADAAMYTAKRRGKDRFQVFEHGMRTDVVERGRVERLLRQALSGRAARSRTGMRAVPSGPPPLWAAFQPIFDSAGALSGFEALARLTDAGKTQIPPEVFIPIAEETGMIRPLGGFLLDRATGQLAAWRRRYPGLEHVTMAVNVSALQIGHASLASDVRRALARHALSAADLVLEMTETALLEAGRSTISTLHGLRAEGIGIAIDNFGIGYASLRYLATMPVSAVKVDRSFTAGLPDDVVSRKIVGAIAALAGDLSLGCIVEGVETAEQLAALPSGVQIQGRLAGAPQPPDSVDIVRLMAGHRPSPSQ